MRQLLSLSVLLVVAACATDGRATPSPHQHRQTTTVTIDERGLLPGATVRIPAFSTVVWRNRGAVPATVEVLAAACPDCETVLAFEATAAGARSSIAPNAIATLCFHEPGSFAFVVHVGNVEHRGSIEVGDAP